MGSSFSVRGRGHNDKEAYRRALLKPFMCGVLITVAFMYVAGFIGIGKDTSAQTAVAAHAETPAVNAAVPELIPPPPLIEKPEPLMRVVEEHGWAEFDWQAELATPYVGCGLSNDIQDFLYVMSLDYGIEYAVALGWIQQESNFDASVISKTNDYGLTQINTVNHAWLKKELGITDFLDPYQSIHAGLYVLRRLYDKYETTDCALMAYNLGEGGAHRLWDAGVWETAYTRNIMKNAATWRDAIAAAE